MHFTEHANYTYVLYKKYWYATKWGKSVTKEAQHASSTQYFNVERNAEQVQNKLKMRANSLGLSIRVAKTRFDVNLRLSYRLFPHRLQSLRQCSITKPHYNF